LNTYSTPILELVVRDETPDFHPAGMADDRAAGWIGGVLDHRFRRHSILSIHGMIRALLCGGEAHVRTPEKSPHSIVAWEGTRSAGLGIAAVAALGLSACGRNGALEIPPGPAGIQPAPAALSAPPPGPVASSSAEPSTAPAAPQETIARTGFDPQGNPAATPGQKKPFLLDPLLR
jgi:hypothetical protein